MKKKVLALVLTLAMVASLLTVPAAAAGGKTFPDAVGHWAEESIQRWSRCGLVNGDELGNVNPNKPLRRCEMATILSNMLGLRTAAPISTFQDIDGSEWYASAILRCAAAGIMEGSNSKSYPEDYITREEAIVMFGRALGVQPNDRPDLSKFSDGEEVSGWAAPYMATLTELGILSGMGDGTIAPHADINRAGTFTLMDKAISVYANAPGSYNSRNGNGFVVINSNARNGGDVVVSGEAAGVLVTVGAGNNVRLRDLEADNVVVNGKTELTVTGESNLDGLAVNTEIPVTVDTDAVIGALELKADGVSVTNAGTVKNLSCASAATVKNTGTVNELVADAVGTITNTGTVDNLVANAAVTIDNQKGTIKNAEINMGGVVMDGAPQQMTVASGVARPSSSTGRPVSGSGATSSGGSSSGGGSKPSKPTPGIKLDKTSANLTEGDTLTLKATVTLPSGNGVQGNVVWTSSNGDIATVDADGKVSALKEGEATITATLTVTIPDPTPSPSPSPDPSEDPSESPSPSPDPSEDPSESPSPSPDPSESPSPSPDPSTDPSTSPDPVDPPTGGDENTEEELPPASRAAVRAGAPAAQADTTMTYTATCKVTVKAKIVTVTGVSLNKTALELEVDGTETLTATVAPENATNQNVTWKSSNTSVATVENGTVTGVTEGNATITVTTEDGGETATCEVTVKGKGGDEPDPPVRVTKVTITNMPTSKISVDDTFDLDAVVEPDNATNQTVTWTTSDPAKATVAADCLVTALQEGEVTITATADGQSDSYTLTIYPKSPEIQVKIEPASLDMVVGDTATLRVVVSPDDTVEREIEWENSSTAITVDNDGKVTAVAQGDTNLWVKVTIAGELYTARCAISVKEAEPQPVPVESVSLNKDTLSLEVDGEETLIATVNPDDADDRTVTWSSADEAIAKVDETGKVTAVGEGTTTITAAAGGQSATCAVTVNAKTPVTVTVTGVELTPTELTAKEGDTLEKLVATVKPEDATNKNVTWTSSNEAVVTVDGEGNVTIVGEGEAIITVTTEDGSHTATCTITVSAADPEEPTEPGGGQGGSGSEETTPSEPGTEEPGTTE